ncbi:ASCH domain-containing protein [Streptomyces sp. NPDC015125]|uniref:ASCH domain-containing protein n=1 Tax=Streptomyces sp. NPDC015125 TaxID=3364938 RepID=UPI0036F4C99A
MKALTVRQPWADAIAHGGKTVENRTWPAPNKHVGTRILIHAAAMPDRHAVLPDDYVPAGPTGLFPDYRGAILAVATLIGSHFDTGTCCQPWGMREVYHWQLADIQPLNEPVPAKGRLGFWTPTEEEFDATTVQLEVAR